MQETMFLQPLVLLFHCEPGSCVKIENSIGLVSRYCEITTQKSPAEGSMLEVLGILKNGKRLHLSPHSLSLWSTPIQSEQSRTRGA